MPEDCRKASITPIIKKGKKEGPGIYKPIENVLEGQRMRWTKNWLNGQAQKITISGTKTNWRPVTRGVPHWSILCLVLFNTFINNQDDGAEYTLTKFADDTKLGRVADTSEGPDESHKIQQGP